MYITGFLTVRVADFLFSFTQRFLILVYTTFPYSRLHNVSLFSSTQRFLILVYTTFPYSRLHNVSLFSFTQRFLIGADVTDPRLLAPVRFRCVPRMRGAVSERDGGAVLGARARHVGHEVVPPLRAHVLPDDQKDAEEPDE